MIAADFDHDNDYSASGVELVVTSMSLIPSFMLDKPVLERLAIGLRRA